MKSLVGTDQPSNVLQFMLKNTPTVDMSLNCPLKGRLYEYPDSTLSEYLDIEGAIGVGGDAKTVAWFQVQKE